MSTHPQLMSGAIVLLPDGAQAVVRHAWDGEQVEVVRTGGDHTGEKFDAWLLTPITRHRSAMVCLICGDVWKGHGDRTSHCSVCHETFEGGVLWDAHRILGADDRFTCKKASAMEFRGVRLRKEADPLEGLVTVGTWRGPKMAAGIFRGDDE